MAEGLTPSVRPGVMGLAAAVIIVSVFGVTVLVTIAKQRWAQGYDNLHKYLHKTRGSHVFFEQSDSHS